MPRSTSAARIRVSSEATPADLPTGSAASRYTWALTVPTRGVIKKIWVRLTDASGIGDSSLSDAPAFFLHTTCANGVGKNTTSAGEETSIIGMFGFTVEKGSSLGGSRPFATGRFAFVVPLAAPQVSGGTSGQQWDAQDATNEIFYDVSGTTKGPVSGTGTLFLTMSGQPSNGFNYTAMTTFTVFLDIEPCT